MLSPDMRVLDFTPRTVWRLAHLLDPPAGDDQEGGAMGLINRLTTPERTAAARSTAAGAPVFCLAEEGRISHALTPMGTVVSAAVGLPFNQATLDHLRSAENASFVCAINRQSLAQLWADAQTMSTNQQDYLNVLLSNWNRLEPTLHTHCLVSPAPPRTRLKLSYDVLQAALDRGFPDGKTIVFCLLNRHQIWACAILGKAQGDIDLVAGHRGVAAGIGFNNLRQAAADFNQRVTTEFGPVHAGVYLSLSTWHRFVNGDRSAIARASAARQAVVDPCPRWLTTIIGAGAVTDAASRSAHLAGKLLQRSRIGSRLIPERAGKVARAAMSQLDKVDDQLWAAMHIGQAWTRQLRQICQYRWPDSEF